MEVVVVPTGAIICAVLQSYRHHQQMNTELFLQTGCPSCRPTNSVRVLKWNVIKLEACIDDERQFKTAERPHAPGDATVFWNSFSPW